MDFAHFFHNHSGKRVKAVMTDGEVLEGMLFGYISAADNDPDPESVIIRGAGLYSIELPTNEIKTIEVIDI